MCGKTPNSWQLPKYRSVTQPWANSLGQRLYRETMAKGQDHGLTLRAGRPLTATEKGGCLDPRRMSSSVNEKPSARTLWPYLWLEHINSRDVWVQRKTVLMGRPFSCRMQNSGWNLDRESLSLWISVSLCHMKQTVTLVAVSACLQKETHSQIQFNHQIPISWIIYT